MESFKIAPLAAAAAKPPQKPNGNHGRLG